MEIVKCRILHIKTARRIWMRPRSLTRVQLQIQRRRTTKPRRVRKARFAIQMSAAIKIIRVESAANPVRRLKVAGALSTTPKGLRRLESLLESIRGSLSCKQTQIPILARNRSCPGHRSLTTRRCPRLVTRELRHRRHRGRMTPSVCAGRFGDVERRELTELSFLWCVT